jgi:hypothetical protein
MQERKPNNTRSAQASRGPAGARAAGVEGAEEGVVERCGVGAVVVAVGSGVGVALGVVGLLLEGFDVIAPGALALRPGSKALAAEAARAATDAAGTGAEADAAAVLAVAVVLVALALDVAVSVIIAVGVALGAADVVVDSGVLTTAVAVFAAGSCANGAGAGLRVNQKAAAATPSAAKPINAQGLDLVCLAEGGN